MFADVGQGAVVLAAGLVLRRRYPLLRLLVSGGIAAMLFGLLFGSVFAREDVVHALWFRPLDRPLDTLLLALALGAAVVLLGLALEALQSFWASRTRHWLAGRAGLVLAYVGLLGTALNIAFAWLALAGAAWFVIGAALGAPRDARLTGLGTAAGEFLETALQLAVNTLSFLRVGAFALAHGGLSIAIVGLAAATGSAWGAALVLVVGNAVVIVIEVLVAGIQTTRLVLFEFFVRFLRGTGREFRPLPALPPSGGPSTEVKA
jgi:V/A-type H+-transporting ATPase subunit I